VSSRIRRAGAVEIERTNGGLVFRVVDYHGDPLHLGTEDLEAVGLHVVVPAVESSCAALWSGSLSHHADAYPRGTVFLDPNWPALAGVQIGGLLFVPVRDGLDVYVTDYHCERVRLDEHALNRLGLRLA
jgi:hypothetical protein